jgi:DNA-binding MarR family transcriptional regulator
MVANATVAIAIDFLPAALFRKVSSVPPRSDSDRLMVLQEIGQLLPRVRRLVFSAATRRLEPTGETMLTWRVLGWALKLGPVTQRDLADAVAQHPAGLGRLLDDLEGRGLVQRTRDAGDRRRVRVVVTPAGRKRWEALLPEVVRSVEQTLSPLSEAQQRTLGDLLRKVVSGQSRAPNGGGRDGR